MARRDGKAKRARQPTEPLVAAPRDPHKYEDFAQQEEDRFLDSQMPWRRSYLKLLDPDLHELYREAELAHIFKRRRNQTWLARWIRSEAFWRDTMSQAIGGIIALVVGAVAVGAVGLVDWTLVLRIALVAVAWVAAIAVAGPVAGIVGVLVDPYDLRTAEIMETHGGYHPKFQGIELLRSKIAWPLALVCGFVICAAVGSGLTALVVLTS